MLRKENKKLTDRERLIALLKKKNKQTLEIEPVTQHDGRLPASCSQQRLWLIENMVRSPQYNIPYVMRLSGNFDIDAAETAINRIIQRHQPLRTVFEKGESGLLQVIKDEFTFKFSVYHIEQADSASQQETLNSIVNNECNYIFDLSKDLMIRADLIRHTGRDSAVLVFNMHHIASDGWSMGIFVNEFVTQYQATLQQHADPLAPLKYNYADFSHWQKEFIASEKLEAQINYWREQMRDVPHLHSLPLSHARPKVKGYKGGSVHRKLSPELSKQLLSLAKTLKVTPFILLHATLGLLIARHGNSNDIVIATPVAGRSRPEFESLIGYFTNTLVLRTNTEHQNFEEYLAHVKQVNLEAQANQDLPVERLIELCDLPRSMQHTPLFQILFSMDTTKPGELLIPSLSITPYEEQTDIVVKFDLEINADISNEIISLNWSYDSSIFDSSYVEALSDRLYRLLLQLNDNPAARMADLSLLSEQESHFLLHQLNSTQVEHASLACVHEMFERQVADTPDLVAVTCDDKPLTYGELNRKANQLARYLTEHRGVTPDSLVGICLERSVEMVTALLAILKAGGAYVPLDPTYPGSRLAYMVDDAKLTTVLTQGNLKNQAAMSASQAVYLDSEEVVSLVDKQSVDNLKHANLTVNNLAYVIYTSGSTGKPKGVMVEHRNVANFLLSMAKTPGIKSRDKLLAVTSISFDIHFLECFLPLIHGARLIVATTSECSSGSALKELLARYNINLMQATPATWQLLIDCGLKFQEGAEFKALCGGEAWSDSLRNDLVASGVQELWNMYGPTETTVWSSVCRVKDEITLGKPIDNTSMYVLDSELQLCVSGAVGELYIAGAGVTRGYLNRPWQTEQRFIVNPFFDANQSSSSQYLYRTGDLVRRKFNGELEYLGRIDDQIKLRGYRIELGEIESQLQAHPRVKEAVVKVVEQGFGDKQLVGYVVPQTLEVQVDDKQTRPSYSLFYFGGETYDAKNKYQFYLEAAKFADKHGFEAIWTPERHFDTVGSLYPNPACLSAALATITERVQLRSGSVVVPLHDPIRIAEEWSVVDNLSNGRVGLALAVGWHTRDFVLSPGKFMQRAEQIVKGTNELKALWAGEKISRKDGLNNDVEVEIFPKPLSKELPLWITAAGNPETFIEAGKQGSNILTHLLGQTVPELMEKIALYRRTLAEHAHDPEKGKVTVMIHTFLGNEHQQTLEKAKGPFIEYMKGHISLLKPLLSSQGMQEKDINMMDVEEIAGFAFERYIHASALIGTPESSLAVVSSLVDAGVNEFACLIDWIDTDLALQGLPYIDKLFALFRDSKLNVQSLMTHCTKQLPHFMVPSNFMVLDEMPKTPNGKTDRKALPAPDMTATTEVFVAPTNDTEEQLCEIWQDVLNISQVGIAYNLFAIGGNSLSAIKIIDQINLRFNTALTLEAMFEAQTIELLAIKIEEQLSILVIATKKTASLQTNEVEITI